MSKSSSSTGRLSLLLAALLAACGGAPAATVPDSTSGPAQSTPAGGATPAPTTDAPALTDAPAASLAPGAINYRVINLIGADSPVDVYVRTQGLVEAAPVVVALAYGAVTDSFAPPDPGTVVVTQAGAGDPTCVGSCPHFIASIGTGSGEGNERTIVLYDEGTQELWHDPDPASVGSMANALPPSDPSIAQIFTAAVGLTNADFGLRLAFEGEDGCQANLVSENILVGGNQIGAFGFDGGSVEVNLHDNRDSECAEEPVGGPFEVTAEAGERVLLVLFGEPGSMEALTLEV